MQEILLTYVFLFPAFRCSEYFHQEEEEYYEVEEEEPCCYDRCDADGFEYNDDDDDEDIFDLAAADEDAADSEALLVLQGRRGRKPRCTTHFEEDYEGDPV